MKDQNERLRGQRAIALVRCSTIGQADTSIPDQLKAIDAFAERFGIIIVEVITLAGVSGSLPGTRTDIQKIIEKKRQFNNFELLLVYDVSRLTRSGVAHGTSIEWSLQGEGIETIYIMDQMPEGIAGDILRTVKFFTANEHARSIGMNVARGQMSAIEKGHLPHSRRQIFGIDVLYVGHDQIARYIIRTLPDGTQLRLDSATGAILQRFGTDPRSGKPAHYAKLKDEVPVYVPGSAESVAVVHQIYRRYFIDRWGFSRIAEELNLAKIWSPTGKPWHKGTIKKILRNTIYTGVGVSNRETCAVYFVRSRGGAPQPSDVTTQELRNRKRPKKRLRDQEEWFEIRQPALDEYLPPEVRQLAVSYQEKYWNDRAAGKEQPRPDRNENKTNVLNGLLHSAQGGYRMFARRNGEGKYRRGYYRVSRAISHPGSLPPVFKKGVPAAPLDQLALHVLQMMLSQLPGLKDKLTRKIKNEFAASSAAGEDLKTLLARKSKLQQQREFAMDNVDVIGKEEARQRLARLKIELAQLDDEISASRAAEPWDDKRVSATADAVISQLQNLSRRLRELPIESVRRVLEVLLKQADVDLESRTATFELALPRWAVEKPNLLQEALCLEGTSGQRTTLKEQTLVIMKFKVYWLGNMYLGYGVAA